MVIKTYWDLPHRHFCIITFCRSDALNLSILSSPRFMHTASVLDRVVGSVSLASAITLAERYTPRSLSIVAFALDSDKSEM